MDTNTIHARPLHRPTPAAPTSMELAAQQLAREAGVGYGIALMLLLELASSDPAHRSRWAFGPLT
jgi:hypothetical protein